MPRSYVREARKRVGPKRARIRPIIDRAFPLEQAAAAHRWMETGMHTGKIILECE